MKYIDADLLRREIEKNKNTINGLFPEGDDSVYDGENDAYNRVLRVIDSLQQEQQQDKPNLLKSLEEYFEKTPKEQLDADWEKLKVWNEIGPDVETYCMTQREQQEANLDGEIEEYWIATEWSKVITLGKFKVIARYFYGLGQLNSK